MNSLPTFHCNQGKSDLRELSHLRNVNNVNETQIWNAARLSLVSLETTKPLRIIFKIFSNHLLKVRTIEINCSLVSILHKPVHRLSSNSCTIPREVGKLRILTVAAQKGIFLHVCVCIDLEEHGLFSRWFWCGRSPSVTQVLLENWGWDDYTRPICFCLADK